MPSWQKWTVLVAVVAAAVLVSLEVFDGWWRDAWKEHPLSAGLVSGGLLLAPLLLVLEQNLERRAKSREQRLGAAIAQAEQNRLENERERWRDPTRDALRTFAHTAIRTRDELHAQLVDAVDQTSVPAWTAPNESFLRCWGSATPSRSKL